MDLSKYKRVFSAVELIPHEAGCYLDCSKEGYFEREVCYFAAKCRWPGPSDNSGDYPSMGTADKAVEWLNSYEKREDHAWVIEDKRLLLAKLVDVDRNEIDLAYLRR